jgi:uncharacterized membrane protein
MKFRFSIRLVLSCALLLGVAVPAWAEQAARAASQQNVRVTGVVRDESNAITLPGIPLKWSARSDGLYRR